MTPQRIAIITAVSREQEQLRSRLGAAPLTCRGGMTLYHAHYHGNELYLVEGGVGKANAAAATAMAVERFAPNLIINTGCCGAYCASTIPVGSVCLATAEHFGDEGCLAPQGQLSLEEISLPLAHKSTGEPVYNTIPMDERLLLLIQNCAQNVRTPILQGSFVTVSNCSGMQLVGDALHERYQAIAESMEGAAVALTALRYAIPFIEIRGVSNLVEDRDFSRWRINDAVSVAQTFVQLLLGYSGLQDWLAQASTKER